MKILLRALLVVLPWFLRRRLLTAFYDYEIDPTARIGLAWVYPKRLVMGPNSQIGHLTVCVHLDEVRLESGALVGRGNWITGFASGHPKHFAHQPERRPRLHLEKESAITHRHIIDCTAEIVVGAYATIAGFRSQLLTHSIDPVEGRQSSSPISIGDHCFVGTNCVILGGAVLPRASVLGASSLLNKKFESPFTLYAGSPAKPVKSLPESAKYFTRTVGYVD